MGLELRVRLSARASRFNKNCGEAAPYTKYFKKGCMIKCVLITDDNSNNGTNAGTFYLNTNNGSGNANQNIGTHVMFYLNQSYNPHHLVKYMLPQSAGSVTTKVLA